MASLPTVTSPIPRDLRLFLDRVREALTSGEFVTLQQITTGQVTLPTTVDGDSGTQIYDPNTGCLVVEPPAPTGVTASGGYRTVYIEWDAALYCGHAYSEVLAAQSTALNPVPTVDDADVIGITPGSRYIHAVESDETWYYWVRFVNINGVIGPINSIDGTPATSAVDVESILTLLTEQITTSQLQQDLAARIDLIDADSSVIGSVDARILTETSARIAAILAEELARIDGDLDEAAARAAAIAQEVIDRNAAISVETAAREAAILAEALARSTADLAEAEARADAIAQEVLDRTAAISVEAQARIDAVASEATDRMLADAQEAQARADAIAQEILDRTAAILVETTAREAEIDSLIVTYDAAISGLSQDIIDADIVVTNTLTSAFQAADAATLTAAESYVETYTYSGADIDAAIAGSASTLTTAYQTADAATLVSAKSYTETWAYSRAQADLAIAAAGSALQTEWEADDATVLSQAQSYTYSQSSIDAAIAQSATTLTTAYQVADAATLASAESYVETWAYSKAQADAAIATAGDALRTEWETDDATVLAAAQSYTYSRSAIDGAIALSGSTLTAAYQAADVQVLSDAQDYTYSQAAIDGALATQFSALTTNYQTADSATLASAQAYTYSQSTIDSAIASSASAIEARLETGGDIYDAIVLSQTTASAKSANFVQATTPTATKIGDLWIDTANGNILKTWDGDSWELADDDRIGATASDVLVLQSDINYRNRIFRQRAVPVSDEDYTLQVNDLWVDLGSENLALYSQRFDNTYWVKANLLAFGSGSVANATTAPDGTLTADLIVESTATGAHQITHNGFPDYDGTTEATWSIYAKPAGRTKVVVFLYTATGSIYVTVDLTTQTVNAQSSVNGGIATSALAVDAGNGWTRCSISGIPSTATASLQAALRLQDSNGAGTYTGDGVSGAYIWGAQLEVAGPYPGRYLETSDAEISTLGSNQNFVWTGSAWVDAEDARIVSTLALLVNDYYTAADTDSAIAAASQTLTTAYEADDADILATLSNDYYTSVATDSAIASAVSVLGTQLRGSYTGTDLDSLTSGLLYSERVARVTEDSALALEISLLSAGSNTQFDYSDIWYFDTGVDSWTAAAATGTVSLTNNAGWLKLAATADTATDPRVLSPDSLNGGTGVNGIKYPQVRARIRKVGSPTWEGKCYFITTTDTTYDATKSATITEPDYDGGIALITWNMPSAWTSALIRRIRLDLSTAVTTADYFELDWVAIGRPSPGASSAELLTEEQARIDGDEAEAAAREALSTMVLGTTDIDGLTLTSLSDGLIYDERIARSSADSTEVAARQLLSTKVLGVTDPTSTTLATLSSGILYDEKTARTTADTSQVSRISTLEATVNDAGTGVVATASALDAVEADVYDAVTGLEATVTRTTSLESTVNNVTSGVAATYARLLTEETTRASADSALSSSVSGVIANLNDVSGVPYSSIISVRTTAESKSANFVQSTTPTATKVGDLWVDTGNGNVLKRWDGDSWELADDVRLGSHASQIATLQSDVNKRNRVFYQRELPVSDASYTLITNDLWVDSGTINEIPYSQTFASWPTKVNCVLSTSDSVAAPDGTLTATKFQDTLDTISTTHYIRTANLLSYSDDLVTAFFYAKAGTLGRIILFIEDGVSTGDNTRAEFNLSTGALVSLTTNGGGGPAGSYRITPVGDGWYRCEAWGYADQTDHSLIKVELRLSNGVSGSYIGDGTGYLYVWGAQLEPYEGPAGRYLPTGSVAVDETGCNVKLVWDGVAGRWNEVTDAQILSTQAALLEEADTRATADTAETTARQALSTKVTGLTDPASLTLATLSSGLLYEERQARSTTDTSHATRLDGLEATVNDPTTGVSATASALDSVEALVYNATTGLTATVTRVTSLESTVNNPTTGVAATATALDAVESLVYNATTGLTATVTRVSNLETTVNNPTTGVAATAAALDVIEASVNDAETGLDATATRVSTIEATVNNATTGVAATATALDAVEALVYNATTGLTATVTRVSSLETTVNNPTTGVTATAAALDAIESAVNNPVTGLSATVTRVSGLETTVNNPTTGVAATATALDIIEGAVNDSETGLDATVSRVTALEVSTDQRTDEPGYANAQALISTRVMPLSDTVRYAVLENDAYLYKNGVVVAGPLAALATGTFAAVQGDLLTCNRPAQFELTTRGDQVPAFSDRGRFFAYYYTRYTPVTLYFYPVSGPATIRINNTAGLSFDFTTPTATLAAGANAVTTWSTTLAASAYVSISASSDVVAFAAGTGGDYTALLPMARELLSAYSTTKITTGTWATAGTYYQYSTDDSLGQLVHAGDGAGSDSEQGIPPRMCGDTYLIAHGVSDYLVISVEPATITVLTTGGIVNTIDHTNASRSNPRGTLVGTLAGSTTLLHTGPVRFEGTAPFALRLNNVVQDEYVARGMRRLLQPFADAAPVAGAIQTLAARVTTAEASIVSNASAITAIETAIEDPATGLLATATGLDVLSAEVSDTVDGLAAAVARLDSVEASVEDPTTGLVATATALDAVEVTVNNSTTGVVATATKVSQLATTVASDNLIPDGHFTLSAVDGVLGQWWATDATASILPTGGQNGAPALRINADATVNDIYARVLGTTAYIAAQKDDVFYVSFDYYASPDFNGGYTGLHLGITSYSITKTNLNVFQYKNPASTEFSVGAWHTVTWELTCTATNLAFIAFRCSVRAGATAGYVLFSNVVATRVPQRYVAIEQASHIDGLEAQYTVKIDANGYVTGFGLASTLVNDTPYSEFRIRADAFSIAAPTPSPTPIEPFTYVATATTVNGVAVPAGLYVDGAHIKNGTITNAKIGNAVIDDAKIAAVSAGKITAGSLIADSYVRSSNYVAGSTGWSISGSGAAEFSNATVRGAIYASTGTFAGSLSAATGNFAGEVNVGSFTGYAWPPSGGTGAHLSQNGLLLGNANDWRYFQVDRYGDVYSPQFTCVNGVANFKGQVNVGQYIGYEWPAWGGGVHLSVSGILIGNANNDGKYFGINTDPNNPAASSIFTNIPFINTININDAQITTLKVAGNAITAPAAAASGSPIAVSSGSTASHAGVGLSAIGQPTLLIASIVLKPSIDGATTAANLRLVRDGWFDVYSWNFYAIDGEKAIPVMVMDYPPAGYHNWFWYITNISPPTSAGVIVAYSSILALEARR